MSNIHLIASSSYHVINNKIKEIIGDNTNITTSSLNDVTIYDVIDDASYFGLFNEARVIIIKDVKYFGGKYNYEEECKAIENFLSHLGDDVTIIFICDTILKSKDITKKVLTFGAKIYDLSEIDDELFLSIINDYIQENNIKIDPPAIELLRKNSLNNLDVFIQDIDKISNIDSHITLDMVKTYGIRLEELDTFDFSNAVVAKKFDTAFELLDKLIASGVDGFALTGVLASSYTNMFMVRDAVNHGLSDDEIAKKLGYSGTGRVYVMKKNSKIYTLDELKEIIISLSELDIKLKTGYNPVYGIKEFLLNL